MSGKYDELLNDVEETKLDDDLDSQIENLEAQKATYDLPEELSLNTGVNNELLQKMAEKLKTMPRNKILQMISSLAKGNQLPDHDFSTFSQSSAKSNSEKLNKKIKELKSKRTKLQSKTNKKSKDCDTEDVVQETQSDDTKHVVQETQSDDTKHVVQENSEASEISGEKKPMTKSQKRRLRAKLHKYSPSTSDYSSVDSNIGLSADSH